MSGRTESEKRAAPSAKNAENAARQDPPPASDDRRLYPDSQGEVRRYLESRQRDSGTHASAAPPQPSNSCDREESSSQSQPEKIGDFRIVRQIGRGGMGIVYEAEQMSLGRHVALKLLPPQMLVNERQRRRFEREARSAAMLHHTNIVPVFGVGESDGFLFYAMQFIQGLGLDEVLNQLRRKQAQEGSNSGIALGPLHISQRDLTLSGAIDSSQFSETYSGPITAINSSSNGDGDATQISPISSSGGSASESIEIVSGNGKQSDFSISDSKTGLGSETFRDSAARSHLPTYWISVADVGMQIASALQYAHQQGVYHRDIKPSNLLLDTQGTAWVLDFGLAKMSDQHDLTHTGDLVGTLRYMSPEAFDGKTDARSDIYSLGLTLYEMLALRPAFDKSDRRKLIKQVTSHAPTRLDRVDPKIPRDLVTIVHKAIDRDPHRRYQTAEEFADDLLRFKGDKPIRARRTSSLEHLYRWSRRNRALATTLGLLTFLLVAINIAGPLVTLGLKKAYDEKVDALIKLKWAYESEKESHKIASEAESRARESLALAKQKEREALESLNLAERRQLALNQTLYRAEMSLAGQSAFDGAGIQRVRELTEPWRPRPGEDDLREWEWYFLHGLGRLDEKTIQMPNANARTVAWHPSGSTIAIGLQNGQIELLNLRTGQSTVSANVHCGPVLDVCWNSEGTALASIASHDDEVAVWMPEQNPGLSTFRMSGNRDWSGTVSFSHDDRFLAADGRDKVFRWDLRSGSALEPLHCPEARQVAWSPAGYQLAAASKQGMITIWDGMTGETEQTLRGGSTGLAWDPQGRYLAYAGDDRRIHVRDIRTGTTTSSPSAHLAEITSLAWDDSGMRLASGGRDTTVRIWEMPACSEIARLRGHSGAISDLDWLGPNDRLASCAEDQTVKVWIADRNREQDSFAGNPKPVKSISWSAQGNRLAASTGSWTHLWDIDRQKKNTTWRGQLAAIHPTNGSIAIAVQSAIEIRNIETGSLVTRFEGHSQGITALHWDPEGKQLATASWDGTARVWNLEFESETARIPLPNNDRDFGWSPDGTCLAIIANREVTIWDLRKESIRLEYSGEHQIHSLAWHPQGNQIATSGWDHQITIWDAFDGSTIAILSGHTSPVTSLCWNPEGTRLASGSEDKIVRVWALEMRGELLSLKGHDDGVTSIGWSPDGLRIASGDRRGRVLIWDASPGHLHERTPQSLDILNRRINASPNLADLTLRSEVLDRMGSTKASADRQTIRHVSQARPSELGKDPLATNLLIHELTSELAARNESQWSRVYPSKLSASNDALLQVKPDGSIHVSGPNESGVEYEIIFKASERITAFKLESIPHPDLPHGGSGRSPKNGNFHVAEVQLSCASPNEPHHFRAINLESCVDDMTDSPSAKRASQSLDGNRRTMWDPFPNHLVPHWAIYPFENPRTGEHEELVYRIKIDSGTSQWGPHGLGCFRLSTTKRHDAVKRMQLVQLLDASEKTGMTHLGGLYALLGERNKAASIFATSIQSSSDHAHRQATVALAKEFDGVSHDLVHLMPDDPWVKLAWADAYEAESGSASGSLSVDEMRRDAFNRLLMDAAENPTSTLPAISDLADELISQRRWKLSASLLQEAFELSRETLSQDHPLTLDLMGELAGVSRRLGNLEQARRLRQQEFSLREKRWGMEDETTLKACQALAALMTDSGSVDEAISLHLRISESAPQRDINDTQRSAFLLAWKGDSVNHNALCRKLLDSAEATPSVKSCRDFSKALAILPVSDRQMLERAHRLAAESVSQAPSNHWGHLTLGMVLFRQGEFDEANRWLSQPADNPAPRINLLARTLLAMIQFRKGEEELASVKLESVIDQFGLLSYVDLQSPLQIHHDDLAIWLTLREAKTLIHGSDLGNAAFGDAILERQKAKASASSDSRLTLHLAAMYAWLGREREHELLCHRFMAESRNSGNPAEIEKAAKACLILPRTESSNLKEATRLAQEALDRAEGIPGLLPWARLTAGIAAYRTNDDEQAVELLTSLESHPNRLIRGPSLLYRSMAYASKGRHLLAAEDLQQARELLGLEARQPDLTEALLNHDELIFQLSYQEALNSVNKSSMTLTPPLD